MNTMLSIAQISEIVDDSEHNIQEFIRDNRIAYLVTPEGIIIPFAAFQQCMHNLYDLTEIW